MLQHQLMDLHSLETQSSDLRVAMCDQKATIQLLRDREVKLVCETAKERRIAAQLQESLWA